MEVPTRPMLLAGEQAAPACDWRPALAVCYKKVVNTREVPRFLRFRRWVASPSTFLQAAMALSMVALRATREALWRLARGPS